VFEGYGAKLFPRAIGYSAGLIDYFFRGRMTGNIISIGSGGPWSQRPTSLEVADLAISDVAGNEVVGPGTVTLVLKKAGPPEAAGIDPPPLVPNEYPDILISNPTPITGNPISSPLSFSFNALPFPTTPMNCSWFCGHSTHYVAFLVFKGTLGQENEQAVVVGGEYCDPGQIWHFYFTHRYDFGLGETASMTAFCGWDPPIQ
jgi:hypothetical protein